VQRVRQREVLLEAVLLIVKKKKQKVKQGVVHRSACTTITGAALPNLMANLSRFAS